MHPQKLEPSLFNKNGCGKNNVSIFKDKNPKVMTDYLLGLFIDHKVKMYNFNRSPEIKELTIAKFRAWLGIHFMTYSWKLPESIRYWSSGVYVEKKYLTLAAICLMLTL